MKYIIITFFIIWGIASIFYQFKYTAVSLGKYNFFSLIPKWTFFAPIPKITDYTLYYQDYDEIKDILHSPVEIELQKDNPLRNELRFLWNPDKRAMKTVTDLTRIILEYKRKHQKKIDRNSLVLELYNPYLLLVNYVSNYSHASSKNCKRRFLIYTSFGFFSSNKPVKTFESFFHELD